jgi:hypothetical protein
MQRILDRMERQGLVECTTQNPLNCRLTKWGVRQMARRGLSAPEIEAT